MDKPFEDMKEMPGHLARRFQQLAVAAFLSQMDAIGCDLTPVQYAALSTVRDRPGIDQATLAGEIAYDRATITGVVDRLVKKGLHIGLSGLALICVATAIERPGRGVAIITVLVKFYPDTFQHSKR